MRLGSPRSYSQHFEEEKYILPLTVFEPRTVQLVVSRYNICATPVPGYYYYYFVGQDSAVVTATSYGLEGTVIESRRGGGARFSAPVQTGLQAHPASYTMGIRSLSRG